VARSGWNAAVGGGGGTIKDSYESVSSEDGSRGFEKAKIHSRLGEIPPKDKGRKANPVG